MVIAKVFQKQENIKKIVLLLIITLFAFLIVKKVYSESCSTSSDCSCYDDEGCVGKNVGDVCHTCTCSDGYCNDRTGGHCDSTGTCSFLVGNVGVCGDGEVNVGEECDDTTGANYGVDPCPYGQTCCYSAGTTNECTSYEGPFCGDGIVDIKVEECDDGDQNISVGDSCTPDGNPAMCKVCNESCRYEYSFTGKYDQPLQINGGIVALGDSLVPDADGNVSPAVELKRNIVNYQLSDGTSNNNLTPSEKINFDSRYIDTYRNLFGHLTNVRFKESGVK